jgi:hypothetical protein
VFFLQDNSLFDRIAVVCADLVGRPVQVQFVGTGIDPDIGIIDDSFKTSYYLEHNLTLSVNAARRRR